MTVVRDHPVPAADAVAGLRDAAAAHRDYGERHGTLHPAVWRALEDSALPQAALPACCGGLEWPPPQILDAVRPGRFAGPAPRRGGSPRSAARPGRSCPAWTRASHASWPGTAR